MKRHTGPHRLSLASLICASLWVVQGCDGAELYRPIDRADATTTPDVDADVDDSDAVITTPVVDFAFSMQSGEIGRGDDTVALDPADELATYAALAGLQTDIAFAIDGDDAAGVVRLLVGGSVLAQQPVAPPSSAGASRSGFFRGVGLPIQATAFVVKVEFSRDDVVVAEAEKSVTTSTEAPCEIRLVTGDSETCAPLVTIPSNNDGEEESDHVELAFAVERVSGTCATVSGTVTDADGTVVGSFDGAFDDDGSFSGAVRVGASDVPVETNFGFAFTAQHASDPALNGRLDVQRRVDNTPPVVTGLAPITGEQSVFTTADDSDPAAAGLQVALAGTTTAADAVVARLFVDDAAIGEAVTLGGAGDFTLPTASFDADGAVNVRIEVEDGCGNVGGTKSSVDVFVTDGAVALVTPVEGAVLLAVNDGDRATATTFEMDASIVAAGLAAGARIVVTCGDDIVVGSLDVTTPSEDGRYLVPVAFPVDTLGTSTSCTASVDGGNTSGARTFQIALPAPTLSVVAPVASELACFNSTNVPVSLVGTGLDGRDITWSAGDAAGSVGTMTAGALVGTVALSSVIADGQVALVFDATDAFGNVVSDTSEPVTTTVRIDRAAPQLQFNLPSETTITSSVTPDANDAVAGFQAVIGGTVTDTSISGEVCVVGDGGPCAAVAADGSWSIEVTLARGDNLVTVVATDDCGNASAEVARVLTLVQELDIAITAPLDGTVLLASNDLDAGTPTTYELDATVVGVGLEAGDLITVACRAATEGSGAVDVGTATVADPPAADGIYTINLAVPVDTTGQMVLCQARVTGANDFAGDEIALTLAIPAPALTVTAPVDGACVAGNSVAVAATTARLDGAELTATVGAASSSAVVVANAFATTIDVSGLDDGGPYAVAVAGADAFGNPVSGGASIILDRSAPALALVSPVGDLDPATTPDSSDDAGYQADIVISIDDPNGSGGRACLTVEDGAPVCVAVDAASVTFASVTLQPGTQAVSVFATDACGNTSGTLAFSLTVLAEPPVVRITDPGTDLVTADTTITITAEATDPDDGTAIVGGTAVVLVNDVASGIVPVESPDGVYTFADVPLTSGQVNAIVVQVTSAGRTGTSAARNVTQKNDTPIIVITTPGDGTITIASVLCALLGVGCDLTAVADTTNVEDGSTALLAVNCGGSASSYSGTVANGAVSFEGVSLPEGSTCVLVARVTDAAGQSAVSEVVTVNVDRTPPEVAFVGLPTILQGNADLDAGTPGIQTELRVSATGAAAGETLLVTFEWVEGGAPQSKTAEATIVDGVTEYAIEEIAGSGVVTWPEGLVTVTATVADDVGNVGTATQDVNVNGTASVAISAPTDVVTTCGASCDGVCFQNNCWRAWGISSSRILSVNVAGLMTTTANLRVCSDSTAITDADAPRCATADSAMGPYHQVLLGDAANGANVVSVASVLPEGYQRLVVEALPVSTGGWITSENATTNTQRRRRIFLDLTAPVVSAVSSPSDTLAPTGVLNADEQVSTPRVFTIAFSTSEAGTAAIVVNGAVVRTEVVDVGDHAFDVTLPEGQPSIWVVLTDAVGNASPESPGAGAVVYQPTVDVTAPTLAFTRPAASPLNATSNRDVVLTSNAEGSTVTVFDDGAEVATGVVTSGAVTFAFATTPILTDGAHRLTATVTDSAGNTRTAATNPAVVNVDTVAPVVTFTSPVDGSELQDVDDADLTAPGFQLDVLFGGDAGSATWTVLTSTNCNASFANCDAPAQVGTGAITNAGGAEPPLRINAPLTAQVTRFKVTVRVTDAAGNIDEETHNVTVTTAICQLVFTTLPTSMFYNATYCDNGVSCATADLEIGLETIGFCAGNSIELLVDGNVVDSSTTQAFGGSFTISVDDGVTFMLRARIMQGANEVVSTAEETRTSDFTPPTVAFVAADLDGFMTPADGDNATFNAELDLDLGTPGMQFHAALAVTDTNAAGGFLSALVANDGVTSVDLAPLNFAIPGELVGASPITTELRDMTLGDAATWSVTASVTDAAGNPGSSSFVALVDVTRPDGVTVSDVVFDKRRPRLAPVSWTAVGDNGMAGGPVTEYMVRYSAAPFTDATWDDACDFEDMYGSEAFPAPANPGVMMAATVGGPDSRPFTDPCKFAISFDNDEDPATPALYVGVRAVDAAGNLSPLTEGQLFMLTNGDVQLETTRIRFDNTDGNLGFTPTSLAVSGANLRDVNGDGIADIGLGIAVANAACVVLGHDVTAGGEVVTTTSGTNHSCITPAIAANVIAGIDRIGDSIVSLGDINGDGRFDFGITGRRPWSDPYVGNPNREAFLFVYLGKVSANAPDLGAPDVVIRGLTSQSASAGYVSACGVGNVNKSGPEDLGFGEPSLNRFHAIPGQNTWVSANGGAPLTIDLASATGVADAGGMTFVMTVTNGTPFFGGRCGRAGNILSTPANEGGSNINDILVAQTGNENGRLFVFPGRVWTAGHVVTVTQTIGATPTAEDRVSLRLRQETTGQQANSIFASDFQGGFDATGDGTPDILVGTSNRALSAGRDGKSIYVFNGARLPARVGGDVRVDIGANPLEGESWAGANGWVMRSDLPGRFGVVRFLASFTGKKFGTPGTEPPALVHANTASDEILVRANHNDTANSFELGLFPAEDGEAMNTFTPGALSMGAFVTGGYDFTGDGLPDIVVGTNFGEVLIIR